MSGSANAGITAERRMCELWIAGINGFARFSNARVRRSVFSLDFDSVENHTSTWTVPCMGVICTT
jgi:hypothetical protein